MKNLFLLTLFLFSFLLQPARARTVEVEVHGMTCAFCVDNLERKFGKMESISKIDVSLKTKKIRLQTAEDQPGLEIIKQTILDAGFKPMEITILLDE